MRVLAILVALGAFVGVAAAVTLVAYPDIKAAPGILRGMGAMAIIALALVSGTVLFTAMQTKE